MKNHAGSSKTILLASDSPESSVEIIEYLREEGFRIDNKVNMQNVCLSIVNTAPDLVMLDFVSPEIDDLAICRDIRSKYQGPIVIVSKKCSDVLHISGLAYGADAFIGKPCNTPLFTAKINSLLRIFERLKVRSNGIIRIGDLTVDKSCREVTFQGATINLTSFEYDLLSYLVNNAGRVVSRNDIYLALYNSKRNGYDRSIDIYISRIRQKIGDDPVVPKYLKTVRGAGYLFVGQKQ
ncbi:MAG: response regulator transcription factor [Planctomycetes bacterium]|nr:response regulator transcription factor [Planctomycetota bacterium]